MSSIKEIVRESNFHDVDYLIENIRKEDADEMYELDGKVIENIFDKDLVQKSFTWEVNGEVVCMFGINPLEDDEKIGVAWLLATENFDKYTKLFAVKCRKIFESQIEGFDYVFNFIHSENKKSIKWLKWLGFNICDAENIGHRGASFNRFEIINV